MTFDEIYDLIHGQPDGAYVEDNAFKLSYGDGETGWAYDLKDGTAILLNSPLQAHLNYLDVVEVRDRESGRPQAGRVVQRGYPRKTGVRYPAGTLAEAKEHYGPIWEACQGAKLACEGHVPGMCTISHHDDTDLRAIFTSAGIDGSELKFFEEGDTRYA